MSRCFNEVVDDFECNIRKVVKVIELTVSNYSGEKDLPNRFLQELQQVLDDGGAIISIVKDDVRHKKAFVQVLETKPILVNKD